MFSVAVKHLALQRRDPVKIHEILLLRGLFVVEK